MLFIHIPKTAGNSIASLGVKYFGHKRLRELDIAAGEQLMTVVRNPYDRAVSTYYYIKQCHQTPNQYCPTQDHDVNDWWSLIYNNKDRILNSPHPFCYYEKQVEFLNDYQGEGVSERIHHVLRYEDLEDTWQVFAETHGLKNLPHLNTSKLRPSLHWSEELNADSMAKIAEMYADDFELLQYQK